MARVSDIYGGDLFTARDVPDDGLRLRIQSIAVRKIGSDSGQAREKIVLYFGDEQPSLALNRTNASIIASVFGDDTDTWIGEEIGLVRGKTTYLGRMVDCIEVVASDIPF